MCHGRKVAGCTVAHAAVYGRYLIEMASRRPAGLAAPSVHTRYQPGSALTQVCDLSLLTEAGPELAVPATKTVTAQMLAVTAVAAAFDSELVAAADLAALPDGVASLLADSGASGASRPADTLAERWAQARRLVVTGRGLAYAAALETALKVKETAQVHAEGLSSARSPRRSSPPSAVSSSPWRPRCAGA